MVEMAGLVGHSPTASSPGSSPQFNEEEVGGRPWLERGDFAAFAASRRLGSSHSRLDPGRRQLEVLRWFVGRVDDHSLPGLAAAQQILQSHLVKTRTESGTPPRGSAARTARAYPCSHRPMVGTPTLVQDGHRVEHSSLDVGAGAQSAARARGGANSRPGFAKALTGMVHRPRRMRQGFAISWKTP